MDALVREQAGAPRRPGLHGRFAPLYAAAFLQSFAVWVPIEKLFMTSIGFDQAGIGVMASVYAVVVPIFEVPSGLLADRWSRRGVLVLACLAAMVSVTVGGLSQDVATYLVAAFFLGICFAMQSGTMESLVYDTLVEETGSSDGFEHEIGRIRLLESSALVTSALVGGVVAEFTSLRGTYFLTVPLLGAAGLMLYFFREPRLHKAGEPVSLRHQIATTYRTLLGRGPLRALIALTVAGALLMQGMLEFGPLWLVALAVPAIWYGPHWAGLTSALGVGGLLGAHRWMTRRWAATVLAGLGVGCCLVLVRSRTTVVVIGVQVLLMVVVVAVSIPLMRRLNDAVPSTVRAGVASGIGTLTWLAFVPFALAIGFLSGRTGIGDAGWLFVAVAVAAGALMIRVLPATPDAGTPAAGAPDSSLPAAVLGPAEPASSFPAQRFLPDDHPQWPGHWATPPKDWELLGVDLAGAGVLDEVHAAMVDMPAQLRQVMLLRDIEGRTPEEAARIAGLTIVEAQRRLHQARGLVRARLERYIEGGDPRWPTSSTPTSSTLTSRASGVSTSSR
jgi:MFS family permease